MKKFNLSLLLLAVIAFFTVNSFAQARNINIPILLSGVVKKTVSENLDGTSESFTFLGAGQEYILKSRISLNQFVNKAVMIEGTLRSETISLTAVEPLQKSVSVIPKSLPFGFREFDSSSKEFEVFTDNFMTLPAPIAGDLKVLVVPVNFVNDQTQTMTPNQISQVVFGQDNSVLPTVKGAFRESSDIILKGSVYPEWITLNVANNCDSNLINNIKNATLIALQQRAVNISDYHKIIFVYPPIADCNIGPAATQGSKGEPFGVGYVWINLSNTVISILWSTMFNELGHTIGLQHSGAISSDGITYGVANRSDSMGSPGALMGLYHKLMIGSYRGKLTTISGSGTYEVYLSPLHVQTKSTKGIIIEPRNCSNSLTNDYILLEDRSLRYPYEIYSGFPNYLSGLILSKGDKDMAYSFSQSFVLDTNTTVDPNDAPMLVGNAYTYRDCGPRIEFLEYSITRGMRIRITIP